MPSKTRNKTKEKSKEKANKPVDNYKIHVIPVH